MRAFVRSFVGMSTYVSYHIIRIDGSVENGLRKCLDICVFYSNMTCPVGKVGMGR